MFWGVVGAVTISGTRRCLPSAREKNEVPIGAQNFDRARGELGLDPGGNLADSNLRPQQCMTVSAAIHDCDLFCRRGGRETRLVLHAHTN